MAFTLQKNWGKIWPMACGIGIAFIILTIFQLLSPVAFDPYESVNPFAYSAQVEYFKPVQIRNEILGMVVGIAAGVLNYRLFAKQNKLKYALFVPGILLLIISLTKWYFTTPVELLWLALPVWTLLALLCYKTYGYFSRISQKKKIDISNTPSSPPGTP